MKALPSLAIRHNLVIVSDEIYEKIIYDHRPHVSIATLDPEVAHRTVVINGVSKTYSMTGWRIGYAAGPKELINAMANVQGQSTSNPTSISQKAAAAALRGDQGFVRQMVGELYLPKKLYRGAIERDERGFVSDAGWRVLRISKCVRSFRKKTCGRSRE